MNRDGPVRLDEIERHVAINVDDGPRPYPHAAVPPTDEHFDGHAHFAEPVA
jgi:hypothetical protein